MNRDKLAAVAKETVSICDAGQYETSSGKQVVIADAIKAAVKGTVMYSPEDLPPVPDLRMPVEANIEVANETTFRGLARLAARGGHIACLNFASARKPVGTHDLPLHGLCRRHRIGTATSPAT